MISLNKGSISVTFDRVIKTMNRSISGIRMITYDTSVAYIAKGTFTEINEMDVKNIHEMIGQCGVDSLNKTANILSLNLKEEF
jgi:hypothetical protein